MYRTLSHLYFCLRINIVTFTAYSEKLQHILLYIRRNLANNNKKVSKTTKFTERVLTAALVTLENYYLLSKKNNFYY